jgi:flagellar biosynthesis anti-sigma factor FlgM
MKVDNPRAQFGAEVTKVTNESSAPAKKPAAPASGDAVRLSGDLRLADEAVRAAAVTDDVRPEAVAKARALVARGEVGNDLERLADKLIDSLLDSHDEPS